MTTSIENDVVPSSTTKKDRLPRRRENMTTEERPGMYLKARDYEILLALFRYGRMTTQMIETLFFNPVLFDKLKAQIVNGVGQVETQAKTRCWNRLQKLYLWNFVDRCEQYQLVSEGRRPYVYYLDPAGLELLIRQGYLDEDEYSLIRNRKPSFTLLRHSLEVNLIRVALELAVKQQGWSITRWITDEQLAEYKVPVKITFTRGRQTRTITTSIVPDALFTIDTGARTFNFFLECDRGTESLERGRFETRDFSQKVLGYGELFRTITGSKEPSLYQKHYNPEDNKGRVLTVTTGPKRADNIKKLIEEYGGENRYWVTSFKELSPHTLLTGNVWRVATRDGLHSLIDAK